jgi:hypothetical protein
MMERKKLYVPTPHDQEKAMEHFEKLREQREKNDKRSSPSPLPVEFCLVCGDSFDEEGMCETCGIAP